MTPASVLPLPATPKSPVLEPNTPGSFWLWPSTPSLFVEVPKTATPLVDTPRTPLPLLEWPSTPLPTLPTPSTPIAEPLLFFRPAVPLTPEPVEESPSTPEPELVFLYCSHALGAGEVQVTSANGPSLTDPSAAIAGLSAKPAAIAPPAITKLAIATTPKRPRIKRRRCMTSLSCSCSK